jgi:hypothetical protein
MAASNVGNLPLGVAILAVLIGLFGLFVIVLGLLFLFTSAGLAVGGLGVSSVFGYTGTIAGIIVLIVGLIILGVAVGLWNQEMWALVLAILVLIVFGVIDFLSSAWIDLVIVVLLLVYLGAVSSHFD